MQQERPAQSLSPSLVALPRRRRAVIQRSRAEAHCCVEGARDEKLHCTESEHEPARCTKRVVRGQDPTDAVFALSASLLVYLLPAQLPPTSYPVPCLITLISRDYLTLPTLPASTHSCPTQVSPRPSRETLTPRRSTSVSVPTETRRASLSYCRRSDRCVVVASREWHREDQHWLIRAHICIPSVTQHPALLSTACQHARLQRQQAEESIVKAKYDKEYLPITGFPEFTKHAALLAYGKDSAPLKEDRVS